LFSSRQLHRLLPGRITPHRDYARVSRQEKSGKGVEATRKRQEAQSGRNPGGIRVGWRHDSGTKIQAQPSRLESTPGRMSGAPCFAGTRVPVQMLLDHPKHGETIEDFLEGAPSVTRE
jgi:uncharacterized protein (DUF433 family)